MDSMTAVYNVLHLGTCFDNLFHEALIIWFQINSSLGSKYIAHTSFNFSTFFFITMIVGVVLHYTFRSLFSFSNSWSLI